MIENGNNFNLYSIIDGITFTGILYHVTTKKRVEKILEEGFDLDADIRTSLHDFGRGVFLGGEFNDWLSFFEFAKIFHDIFGFDNTPNKNENNVVVECFIDNAYLYDHHKEEKIIFATEFYNKIRNNFDGISSQYKHSTKKEYCIWNLDKIKILGLKKEE
jgi:hypothetical protein